MSGRCLGLHSWVAPSVLAVSSCPPRLLRLQPGHGGCLSVISCRRTERLANGEPLDGASSLGTPRSSARLLPPPCCCLRHVATSAEADADLMPVGGSCSLCGRAWRWLQRKHPPRCWWASRSALLPRPSPRPSPRLSPRLSLSLSPRPSPRNMLDQVSGGRVMAGSGTRWSLGRSLNALRRVLVSLRATLLPDHRL